MADTPIKICPLCFFVPLPGSERFKLGKCSVCQTVLNEVPGTSARLTAKWDFPDGYVCPCGCNGKPANEQQDIITLETFHCNGAVFSADVHGRHAGVGHSLGRHDGYGLISVTLDNFGAKR